MIPAACSGCIHWSTRLNGCSLSVTCINRVLVGNAPTRYTEVDLEALLKVNRKLIKGEK